MVAYRASYRSGQGQCSIYSPTGSARALTTPILLWWLMEERACGSGWRPTYECLSMNIFLSVSPGYTCQSRQALGWPLGQREAQGAEGFYRSKKQTRGWALALARPGSKSQLFHLLDRAYKLPEPPFPQQPKGASDSHLAEGWNEKTMIRWVPGQVSSWPACSWLCISSSWKRGLEGPAYQWVIQTVFKTCPGKFNFLGSTLNLRCIHGKITKVCLAKGGEKDIYSCLGHLCSPRAPVPCPLSG